MAQVVLLFGGRSAEHEVSCVSAVAVAEALREAGHTVFPVGITKDGSWREGILASDRYDPSGEILAFGIPSGELRSPGGPFRPDVVFPVLHGPFGEDGTIQGVFEIADVPYVGCGVLASAVAMDKDLTKRLAAYEGIPTARWQTVDRGDFFDDPARVVGGIEAVLGLPVFVKPVELGSSVGISQATTSAGVKDSIELALTFGERVLVEEAVEGREIEVAVLEGPRASVPGEIVTATDWYDYDAKYNDDRSQFVTPADLTPSQTATVRALASRVFTALRCRGLARVDFFLEESGRGFLFNEINTMPGFTPISGFPLMWQASGMSYGELCDELVRIALDS